MANDEKQIEFQFVNYLERLNQNDNKAALATLRKAAGKPPGSIMDVYPTIVPWLREDAKPWEERTAFTIAPLFALHPKPGGKGNMGYTFNRIKIQTNSESTEGRFVALLNCHPDDLYKHLRHAISLAKSKDISINWHQLYYDMQQWSHPDGFIQKQWAKSFWSRKFEEKKDE